MSNLPYVTATGNIERALNGIKSAATPERVNQDFVKTILKIPGGSGNQMTSYLKKIGFAGSDGTPTDIYRKFRNSATRGKAAAAAIDYGYGALKKRNEYWYKLSDKDLKGLVIEETGQEEDSTVVSLILSSIKALKKFADWDSEDRETEVSDTMDEAIAPSVPSNIATHASSSASLGLNLSYTINLNLPATNDISVFNAIFKSLKENLLTNNE